MKNIDFGSILMFDYKPFFYNGKCYFSYKNDDGFLDEINCIIENIDYVNYFNSIIFSNNKSKIICFNNLKEFYNFILNELYFYNDCITISKEIERIKNIIKEDDKI